MSNDEGRIIDSSMLINEVDAKQKKNYQDRMKSISAKLRDIDDVGDMFNDIAGANLPDLYQEGILSVYAGNQGGGVNNKLKSGHLMTERISVPPTQRPKPQYNTQQRATMDGLMDEAANMVTQDALYERNDPASTFTQANRTQGYTPHVHGDWNPVQVIIESKGKEKTRWSVRSGTGDSVNEKFRHEIVAATVAALLNETQGNVNDPRLSSIIGLCDQETNAIKEFNSTKRLLSSVPSGNKKRRDILETKLDVLKEKISTIRIRLGVR